MDVFIKFVVDFLETFFGSLWSGISGLFMGFIGMFNVVKYVKIFKEYAGDFTVVAWILAILTVILLVAALGALVFVIYLAIRKYVRFRTSLVSQEELLNEVGKLNHQIVKLSNEKDRILAMKVSHLGLKPDESEFIDAEEEEEKPLAEGESRFYKCTLIDEQMRDYVPKEYNYDITLSEICDMFRNFACSRMGLFYEIKIIRLFVAAFASTRLIILQGISGTGKTSLPYAFGKFIQNDTNIASVQPSWRDRTELYGYFNEFTKRFNETETLKRMYEATYTEDVFLTILDEMNIARIE